MIPAIGYMVGAYIILRCVDLLSISQDRFGSPTGASITRILAMLVIPWTALMLYLVFTSELNVAGLK